MAALLPRSTGFQPVPSDVARAARHGLKTRATGVSLALTFILLLFGCSAPTPQQTQAFFPILPWELGKQTQLADPRQGIPSLADCGFTTVAFVRPSQLPMCERLRLRAIVCPEKWQTKWRELSDQQIFDTVQN